MQFTAGSGANIFGEDAYSDNPGPKPSEDPGKTNEGAAIKLGHTRAS